MKKAGIMNNPLVSIIILTYNNIEYFNSCINSIFEQSYNRMEIIISDDCSNNFNENNIKEYIEKNKGKNIVNYKIIYHEKNLGTVKNFNNAIIESSGEIIIPVAVDDCFYDKNAVKYIVKYFLDNNNLILTYCRVICKEEDSKIKEILPTKKQINLLYGDVSKLFKSLCKVNFISGASTSYSRKFFSKYGLFDEEYKLLEDYPKYLQVLRQGEKIHFLPRILIKYRLGGISTRKVINPILKSDFDFVIKKEILPYKKKVGSFLYRLKKFEYYKAKKKYLLIILMIIFPDIVFYKVLKKIKIVDKNI